MSQFTVVFYEKSDGTSPVYEYIDSLPVKLKARIYKIALLLEMYGTQVRMPYSEHLRDGIFQIRAQQEGNISRVLYFFATGKKIIFTNGFTKKTNKTPPAEIELAKKYKTDYEQREAEKQC